MGTDQANREACRRILDAHPVWKDVRRAIEVIPGMKENTILYTDPPLEWGEMAFPMKAAITGAIIFEGLCSTMEEADFLIERGEVILDNNQNHSAIGPFSGPISASMAVGVIENLSFGNRVYTAPFNSGKKPSFYTGVYSKEAVEIQKWIRDVWAPVTSQALKFLGGIDCRTLVGRSMLMGDEHHCRNLAATSLLLNALILGYIQADLPKEVFYEIMAFMQDNIEMFYATPHLAVCKAMLDPAHGVEGSTVVTKMSSNGIEWGIMVSGLKDQWFRAPAPTIKGLYFPGFSSADAHPDLGGSRIKETAGFGGMCIASSPAICLLTGGKVRDILKQQLEMYEITVTENPAYQIPYLDFKGIPTGIDVRKVIETGITPVITTGICHRRPKETGFIGVGLLHAPMECFEKALMAF
jgi:hypothetical protein